MVVTNAEPELTWTGEEGYSEDGVLPNGGTTNDTDYEFRITYSDPDGEAPSGDSPLLYIDADDELLARPSFPECDAGVIRNPELDCMDTHLQLSPFLFLTPGRGANAFLGYRERSMETRSLSSIDSAPPTWSPVMTWTTFMAASRFQCRPAARARPGT